MRKAVAIAIPQENALTLAAQSASNLFAVILDRMYGTPERARLTYWFAIALAILGASMTFHDAHALAGCSV